MKIAFLSFYSGSVYRGVETFVDNLAQNLSQDHSVYVYQAGPKIAERSYETQVFTDTVGSNKSNKLFVSSSKFKELLFVLRLLPNLLNKKVDILIPMNSGWNIPLLKVVCKVSRIKLVIIGESGPGWDDRWNLFWKPDLFICLTSFQQKWAKKVSFWKNQKYAVIPNGVDLKKFSPQGPKTKLTLQKPVICIAAASTEAKRVDATIRAVAKLNKASLLVLGTGPLDNEINTLGAKLLGPNRFLHQAVSPTEIPDYLRTSNLFTLCSESTEAFGIVYIEALACGVGCVATADDSRQEIIGPAGMFVANPEDSEEYADVLSKALQTNWRQKALEQAQKYSFLDVAFKYKTELAKLLIQKE